LDIVAFSAPQFYKLITLHKYKHIMLYACKQMTLL